MIYFAGEQKKKKNPLASKHKGATVSQIIAENQFT